MAGRCGDVVRMVTRSEVRYARSGDAHVAYRELVGAGAGAHDVVYVKSGTMPMDALFEDPVALRCLEGLAECGRLIIFDRRGIGLSDPLGGSDQATFAGWCDDLEAVIAATQARNPALFSNLIAALVTFLFCARHPNDASSLIMLEPVPPHLMDRDMIRGQIQGEIDSVALMCPSRADEPGFREWFHRAGQQGASPGSAERAYPRDARELDDIGREAARVQVPALVLRRPENPHSPPRESDPIVALLPGAVRVDLPGEDLAAFGSEVDALLVEVSRFLTGEHHVPIPERVLAAVLYTDLVASTDRATTLGDARWKRLLDRHDSIARACVARRGGTLVKTTGDGIVAMFPAASNAFLAAQDLRSALREEQLEVRVGIHVGDLDHRGDDISGVGVVTAARIMNLGGPGEILASSTAVQAANGASLHFEPRGEHQLKGVAGAWYVFALTALSR
jgi:class 3 adenylate cyclase/pimeloyl-ACP methyl ester carboxylesterase